MPCEAVTQGQMTNPDDNQQALDAPSSSLLSQPWVPPVALLLLTILAYAACYGNGFVWDDDNYVTNNVALRSVGGLADIWLKPTATPQYYPLVHTMYWLEYQLWGTQAFGYHLVNVLLHAGAAVMLFFLLRRWQLAGAWLAAAVFAVHPIEVESVAWITERKNVLSGLLFLLALWSCLRAFGMDFDRQKPKWGWYLGAFGLFVGALLSKTVTCSLPAVLLVLAWWRRDDFLKRLPKLLAWLAPFFVVGAILALVTVRLEREHVGAIGEEWNYSLVERVLIAGRCLWFYLGKLVWPQPLIFFYERWTIDTGVWWQYLFPVGFAGLLAALFALRRRIGRGPLAAMLIFAGVLLPALGFFNVYPHRYSFVADHFQYHGGIAAIVLLAAGGAWLFRHFELHERFRLVSVGLPTAILILFTAMTLNQCLNYRSRKTLWQETIVDNPASWAAHNNLGIVYLEEAEYELAAGRFAQAAKLKPDHAQAHMNCGIALSRIGEYAAAHRAFAEALRVKPDLHLVHLHAGNAYAMAKDFPPAIEAYRTYLQQDPQSFAAALGLGHVYMQLEDYAKAEIAYTQAVRLHNTPETRACLERAQAELQKQAPDH